MACMPFLNVYFFLEYYHVYETVFQETNMFARRGFQFLYSTSETQL